MQDPVYSTNKYPIEYNTVDAVTPAPQNNNAQQNGNAPQNNNVQGVALNIFVGIDPLIGIRPLVGGLAQNELIRALALPDRV